jgi:hypothetical protein
VVEMHHVDADLDDLTPMPVIPDTIDEIDDEGDDSVEEEDGVKDSDTNKAKKSDTGNTKDNEDGHEDIGLGILASQDEASGVVSDATTLDNHDSATDEFTLISKAASGVITESDVANPGASPLLLWVTLSYTSTQRLSSNPLPRENARLMHNQEGERRRSRLTDLMSEHSESTTQSRIELTPYVYIAWHPFYRHR